MHGVLPGHDVPRLPGRLRRRRRHARGSRQPRKQLDAWQKVGQAAWRSRPPMSSSARLVTRGPGGQGLTDAERAGLAGHVGAEPGDCIFFAAGAAKPSRALLRRQRLEIGRRSGLIDERAWSFLWVVDTALRARCGGNRVGHRARLQRGTAVHHAFTSPKKEFEDTFDEDPGSALAYAYDLVCNGNEIGGGSIRIHRRDVKARLRGHGDRPRRRRRSSGFLLDAFQYGAPPHGSIAFGWDHIVSLLALAESIRDVIAFPKSGGGFDPLTGAPGAHPRRCSGRKRGSTRPPSRRRHPSDDPTTARGMPLSSGPAACIPRGAGLPRRCCGGGVRRGRGRVGGEGSGSTTRGPRRSRARGRSAARLVVGVHPEVQTPSDRTASLSQPRRDGEPSPVPRWSARTVMPSRIGVPASARSRRRRRPGCRGRREPPPNAVRGLERPCVRARVGDLEARICPSSVWSRPTTRSSPATRGGSVRAHIHSQSPPTSGGGDARKGEGGPGHRGMEQM